MATFIETILAALILAAQDRLATNNKQRNPLSRAADGRALVEMNRAEFA